MESVDQRIVKPIVKWLKLAYSLSLHHHHRAVTWGGVHRKYHLFLTELPDQNIVMVNVEPLFVLIFVLLWNGSGYFKVKTALPLPFLAKNWPLCWKDERKTASNFALTERSQKGLEENWTFFLIIWINRQSPIFSSVTKSFILVNFMQIWNRRVFN